MKDFYSEWSPLNDVWEQHGEQIKKSSQSYFLRENKQSLEELIWPDDLYIGENELDDVNNFITERAGEMIEIIRTVHGVPPDMLTSYLLRTLIAGMLWQNERIGR